MKKFGKIMLAIFACFVVALSPVLFTGCGSQSLSKAEVDSLWEKAATSFFKTHRDVENFSDVLYSYSVNTTETEKVVLHYKQNAADEEYLDKTFTNKQEIYETINVGIKKIDGRLAMQIKITKLTGGVNYELNVDETLNETHPSVHEEDVYKMYSFVQDSETKYVMTHTHGLVGSEPTTKEYYLKSAADYNNFVSNTMIKYTNEKVRDQFFTYAELLLYENRILSTEKDGNKVNIKADYSLVGVDNGNEVYKHSVKVVASFRNNKIWKAEARYTNTRETTKRVEERAFVIYENPQVDVSLTSFEGYTTNSNLWANCGENVLQSLPEAVIML